MKTTDSIQQIPNSTSTVSNFNFFDPVQFDAMQRACKLFASSDLVPDMYKINLGLDKNGAVINPESKAIANCMIAIEMSQRIGASPLMIMQNMVIIYGRPSWSSKFLVATVNTCGRFNPLQYKFTNLGRIGKVPVTEYVWDGKYKKPVVKEFDGTQIDNIQCIAYTTSKGSNEVLESSPISIKLAIQEGWYLKAGSKWQTMERQMLMYRAASFWTNAYAPELSMGMKTEDELSDIIDIPYEDVSEKVEKEKAKSANKTSINIDDAQELAKPEETPSEPVKEEPASNVQEHVQNFENEGKANESAELFEAEKPKKAEPGF